jgi:hypothetical protein
LSRARTIVGATCAALLAAGCVARRVYDVPRAGVAPVVDGVLDDSVWERAPRSERFVDIEGDSAPRPRLATHVRMLWDDDALYVAAEIEEPDVWATVTGHDEVVFHDDDFEVFLDPGADALDYLEIEVNAFGTVWDLWLPRPYGDGGGARSEWESGARVAVHVDGTIGEPDDRDRGWTVEMAIPWRRLSVAGVERPPRRGEAWAANFARVDWADRPRPPWNAVPPGTPHSNWAWSPPGIVDMHRPERWGVIRFSD